MLRGREGRKKKKIEETNTSFPPCPTLTPHSMAYKRQSTLVGLPDQDRGWEDVQAKTFTKWLVENQ